ncbi:MAG: cation:proton antiporter [Nanoarchaeota archaeon]|nr:cation:proton antiporter [Nanoarchaeota archaeon]
MDIQLALGALALFGATIFLGYIGNIIFDKTKIPDIVWLLIFGLLVGPVFGLLDRALFIAVSPLLSAIAILFILFDAGLNMNIFTIIRGVPRATLLSVMGLFLSITIIGGIAMLLFKFDLLTGFLLGAILGGTSSAGVISLVASLKIKEEVKTLLELESIISDPLCIVISMALIQTITSTVTNDILHTITASFSIGLVAGAVAGLIWLFVLDFLKGKPFDYMLTLATLFLLYSFVETISGSGAIAMLFFGIMLGNGTIITKGLKLKKEISIGPIIKTFNNEITFFVRSFFFVYLGLISSFNPIYAIYGIAISVVAILIRILAVKISMFGTKISEMEMNIVKIMTPKGLAAAVLAQLPIQYGMEQGYLISDIVFIVILSTVIYSAIAIKVFYKPEIKEEEKNLKTEKVEKKRKL